MGWGKKVPSYLHEAAALAAQQYPYKDEIIEQSKEELCIAKRYKA